MIRIHPDDVHETPTGCRVVRPHSFTGERRAIELAMSRREFLQRLAYYTERGATVQDAFDTLTDDERLFLIDGMTPEEWDALWPEED